MSRVLDLTNQQFGRLTVIRKHHKRDKWLNVLWECLCECGNTSIVATAELRRPGGRKSCGCLRSEVLKETNTKHGLHHTSEYGIWCKIKDRCLNEQSANYVRYGARSITICDDWKESFEVFYRDMGPRPSLEHSIERKDNDKGYSKENCRWATREEQANNRRSNVFYEYKGESKTLAQWCKYFGVKYKVAYYRINTLDWAFEEVVQPIDRRQITYDDVTKTLEDWCDLLVLNHNEVYLRILRGDAFRNIISS